MNARIASATLFLALLFLGRANAAEPAQPAAAPETLRATQLIGHEALGDRGELLGVVKDFSLDPATGRIAQVVVEQDGQPRTLRDVRLEMRDGKVVVAEGAAPAGEPAPGGLHSATQLLDARLKDPDKGPVAEVHDMIIRGDEARVSHVVVEFDPSWYETKGWVALPLGSVKPEGRDLVARFDPDDIRPVGAKTAAAKPAAAPPPKPLLAQDVRLSKLVGAPVKNGAGETLGAVKDLVVDMGRRAVSFAIVSQRAGPQLACRIAPDALALRRGALLLAAESASLQAACSPLADARGPAGLRASELLRTRMADSNGNNVGRLREVVVERESARLHYIVADFQSNWLQDGKLVALPLREVRAGSEGLTMLAALSDLHGKPVFEEKRLADVWSPAFAQGMHKYLYGS